MKPETIQAIEAFKKAPANMDRKLECAEHALTLAIAEIEASDKRIKSLEEAMGKAIEEADHNHLGGDECLACKMVELLQTALKESL